MKHYLFVLISLVLVLSACGTGGGGDAEVDQQGLVVTDGTLAKSYTVSDLEKLPVTESTFGEVAYKGVSLPALLADAGFDPAPLRAVKAVAADGYSMNYDPALFQRPDVVVAYATVDGPLTADDGLLRLVLPGEEGKLNLRMLVELKVTP